MKRMIYFFGVFFFLFSCDSSFIIKDKSGNKIGEAKITEIEFTTGEKEKKKLEMVRNNVEEYLLANREVPAIKNYWVLMDSSKYITILKDEFKPQFDKNSIKSFLGNQVVLSPLPKFYKIEDGPSAKYNIQDSLLGQLSMYKLTLNLNSDYSIKTCHADLAFSRVNEKGVEKVSFRKNIPMDQGYLLEDKIRTGNW